MLRYFDREGDEITKEKWVALSSLEFYKPTLTEQISIPDGWIRIRAFWDGKAEQFGPNGPMIFKTEVREYIRGSHTRTETHSFSTEKESVKNFNQLVETYTDPGEVGKSRERFAQVAEEI